MANLRRLLAAVTCCLFVFSSFHAQVFAQEPAVQPSQAAQPDVAAAHVVSEGTQVLDAKTQKSVIIGAGSTVVTGQLASGAPLTGVLSESDIENSGSLTVTASSINILSGAHQTTLNSVGDDMNVEAGKLLSIGANTIVRVDGGNMFLKGGSGVTGLGMHIFVVRALGTAGGGMQLAAGNGPTDQIENALNQPKGTAPNPSQLGTNVVIDNGTGTAGAIQALTGTKGQTNLSTSGTNTATLNVSGGGAIGKPNLVPVNYSAKAL